MGDHYNLRSKTQVKSEPIETDTKQYYVKIIEILRHKINPTNNNFEFYVICKLKDEKLYLWRDANKISNKELICQYFQNKIDLLNSKIDEIQEAHSLSATISRLPQGIQEFAPYFTDLPFPKNRASEEPDNSSENDREEAVLHSEAIPNNHQSGLTTSPNK